MDEVSGKNVSRLEISLEYLFGAGAESMRWITIESDQAILMSMTLQSMVDEILLKHVGKSLSPEDYTPGLAFTRSASAANDANEEGNAGIGNEDL